MKLEMSSSLLDLGINVNTYGGDFEADLDLNGLSDAAADEIYDNFSIELYDSEIVTQATSYLNENLKEFNSVLPTGMKIKSFSNIKMYHPNAYNYETDLLYFDIEVSDNITKSMRNAVNSGAVHIDFSSYKSHDGFMSFMPHNLDSLIESCSNDVERAYSMISSVCLANSDVELFAEYFTEHSDLQMDMSN